MVPANDNVFVKKKAYFAQRSKPWHIRKPQSVTVFCGNVFSDPTYNVVTTNVLPDDQIVCSRCEFFRDREPGQPIM